ncbi:CDP-glycerol glycerophosphotransferase family protein [Succinimonas amylolytica]|uniref:CDP-glycerol glycerophosphotransferase family protein n=1 Tax=Succinimonas amylolytica TaxID=83769 RepID=UPI0003A23AA1|nr:CDP-glycerol glycerophosphotransferase family protein [Succinimonas amylolytica]
MKYKTFFGKVFKIFNTCLKIMIYRLLYFILPQHHVCMIYAPSSKRYENLAIIEFFLKKSLCQIEELNENDCYYTINSSSEIKLWYHYNRIKIFHIYNDTNLLKVCYYLACSKVVVLDQTNRVLSVLKIGKNTKCIQAWHGGGLYKKVGFDAYRHGYSKEKEEIRVRRIHRNIDYFVISDEKLTDKYSSIFRISKSKIIPYGIPRTDIIYKRDVISDRTNFYERYPSARGKKILVFTPTFRSYVDMRRCCTDKTNQLQYNYQCCKTHQVIGKYHNYLLDFELMARELGNEFFLILRKHPTVQDGYEPQGWISDTEFPNSLMISVADILITDYSSILFDFCITGKPIILYVPDFKIYEEYERGLYIRPDELAGENNVFYDTEALVKAIKGNTFTDSTNIFKNYMSACDGNSTSRLVKFIKSFVVS